MKLIVTTQDIKFNDDKDDYEVTNFKSNVVYEKIQLMRLPEPRDIITKEQIINFMGSDQEIMVIELFKSKV